jgi:hypothetical protein
MAARRSPHGACLYNENHGIESLLYQNEVFFSSLLDYAALAAADRSAPANTRWVLVALDTTPAELAAATAKLPFSATHCRFDGPDRAAFAAGLKVRRLPYAYVLQPGGNLTTYGRLAELPALLAALNNQ